MQNVQEVQTVKGLVISRETFRRQDLLTPLLWGLLAAGLLVGASRGDAGIATVTAQFLSLRQQGDWQAVLLQQLASLLGSLSILFVCGLCAVGQPGALAVVVVRGLGVGGLVGALYRQMGFSGLGWVLMLAIPEALAVLCLLVGARTSLHMSGRMLVGLLSADPPVLRRRLQGYGIRFLLLGGGLLLSALVSGLLAGIVGPLAAA